MFGWREGKRWCKGKMVGGLQVLVTALGRMVCVTAAGEEGEGERLWLIIRVRVRISVYIGV